MREVLQAIADLGAQLLVDEPIQEHGEQHAHRRADQEERDRDLAPELHELVEANMCARCDSNARPSSGRSIATIAVRRSARAASARAGARSASPPSPPTSCSARTKT